MMFKTFFPVLAALATCDTAISQESTNAMVGAAKIVIAPYVQAVSPESVVIQWRTDQPAYGWVEYGEGERLGTKQDASVLGLRRANVLQHRVTITGLRPGTVYYYRAHFKPIRTLAPYRVDYGPEQTTELLQFRTLPGPTQEVTAIVFNDLHNSLPVFRGVLRVVDKMPFDFSVFNGDCLADPQTESQVFGSLSAFTQGVQAGQRPTFFIRGNHETRGALARGLPELIAWPGEKPYFAFTAGPVRFLVMDCGEDKPDNHKEYYGLADFETFRREETQWLRSELKSREFHGASWRVLVVHMPLSSTRKNGGTNGPSRELWQSLLGRGKIDLALHAHLHRSGWYPAGSVGNSYPFAIGGGNQATNSTVMIVQADSQKLRLRTLNAQGKEVLPFFEKKK